MWFETPTYGPTVPGSLVWCLERVGPSYRWMLLERWDPTTVLPFAILVWQRGRGRRCGLVFPLVYTLGVDIWVWMWLTGEEPLKFPYVYPPRLVWCNSAFLPFSVGGEGVQERGCCCEQVHVSVKCFALASAWGRWSLWAPVLGYRSEEVVAFVQATLPNERWYDHAGEGG
jgi:hypothetical protein